MMGSCPYEDNEETRCDLDEVGRARTFSLIGTLSVLVGSSSRPTKASIGCSTYSKLVGKQTESRDPTQGVPILKGILFV